MQGALKKEKLDACLLEHPLELYYFTGLKLSAGRLLVHPKECLLLVDGRYSQAAQSISFVTTFLDGHEKLVDFCKQHKVKRLGFDGMHTSYDHLARLNRWLKNSVKLVPSSPFFKTIRAVKDPEEIKKMEKSAALLWKGFKFVSASLKKGITERELAKKLEIFWLEHGADRLSFEPIIAFGPNSAMPHYRPQDVPLKEGDVVLVDIGVCLDNYQSDMTRVLFFKKENRQLRKLYDIIRRAQKSALKLCRPGAACKELDIAVRQVMRKEKVEHLFIHSLGHGIGLEVHEYPRIKFDGEDKDVILEKGMVITVEPGLYIPDVGGVRYEDTIVITATGYKNFYPDTQ